MLAVDSTTIVWLAKVYQRTILDPLLGVTLGVTTLSGVGHSVSNGCCNAEEALDVAESPEFKNSAQVVTVWFEVDPRTRSMAGGQHPHHTDYLASCIYTHHSFMDPMDILNRGDITLKGLSASGYVVFDLVDVEEDFADPAPPERNLLCKVKAWFINPISPHSLNELIWKPKRIILLPFWAFNLLASRHPQMIKVSLGTGSAPLDHQTVAHTKVVPNRFDCNFTGEDGRSVSESDKKESKSLWGRRLAEGWGQAWTSKAMIFLTTKILGRDLRSRSRMF